MKYSNIVEGKFISRPNRFIAHVLINDNIEICHVKNTGRCKELLVEGACVFLEYSDNIKRKTSYSLIAVQKGNRLINIDSQAPNKVLYEGIMNGVVFMPQFENITMIKPEKVFGSSRLDFYIENNNLKGFIEVKGITLEENGIVKFPDAPTERGLKHIYELIKAKEEGYHSYIVFIVQMNDVKYFTPNDKTHKEFGEALRYAKEKGVQIFAYECNISPSSITLNGKECKVIL
ncbi:DNA/RNA nuclease SfsA [Alkalibaculum sp. M08DMB]|uniref:Sugar fermentation stimulation protein homolog n=1 Tax=Alkalibaculum sporogenes TaxID=2655001 RepID=A0A6A7K6I9_9FIRM|nr:DNA/RNA nuclease SfsA [Alkalibaculum sporogenes]MPW25099.1 DNA/RNA nuclease SfsA [Alkalibaculum sporogenes]